MSDDQDYSLQTARDAAARDDLDAWVRGFLASPGSDNAALAEILSERIRCWTGPVRLPLHRLHRLAGPPGDPVLVAVDEEYWDERIDEMEACIEEGWQPPPVIVAYRDGELVLEDGNHRVESLRQAGERHAWALVGFETEEDAARFSASRAA